MVTKEEEGEEGARSHRTNRNSSKLCSTVCNVYAVQCTVLYCIPYSGLLHWMHEILSSKHTKHICFYFRLQQFSLRYSDGPDWNSRNPITIIIIQSMQLLYYYSYLIILGLLINARNWWFSETMQWKTKNFILILKEKEIDTSKQVHARN